MVNFLSVLIYVIMHSYSICNSSFDHISIVHFIIQVEIHHSRKMSTLILCYAREHHMGKYTLVAQNHLGHDVSNCDLIVRKKQFPPVFWRRLVDMDESSGARVVAEVEVGGWPIPEIAWFKDGFALRLRMSNTKKVNDIPHSKPLRKVQYIRGTYAGYAIRNNCFYIRS